MQCNLKFTVGDWVTQYSAGFWKVVNIIPKYADEDYSRDAVQWRKGDMIGYWVLLKKGFTPKMKFRLDYDCVDAQWCIKVSEEQLREIQTFLESHPKEKEKFENAPWKDRLAIWPIWIKNLDAAEFTRITQCLTELPEKFTAEAFFSFAKERQINVYFTEPGPEAKCILYLYSVLYEVDEDKNSLHCRAELRRTE